MQRKTIDVNEIRAMVNDANCTGTGGPETRLAHNSLLEAILHRTGNYNGYGYLPKQHVPHGCLPGIIPDYDNPENHQFPDETRRQYY